MSPKLANARTLQLTEVARVFEDGRGDADTLKDLLEETLKDALKEEGEEEADE